MDVRKRMEARHPFRQIDGNGVWRAFIVDGHGTGMEAPRRIVREVAQRFECLPQLVRQRGLRMRSKHVASRLSKLLPGVFDIAGRGFTNRRIHLRRQPAPFRQLQKHTGEYNAPAAVRRKAGAAVALGPTVTKLLCPLFTSISVKFDFKMCRQYLS